MAINYSFIPHLFNENIYIIRPPRKTESPTFRGNVFFFDYPGIASLPTKEKILLNKITESVNLKEVQVRIVNIPELLNHMSTRAVVHFYNAKVIFFTGKLPGIIKQPQISEKYRMVSEGNNDFVLSDNLEQLDQDKSLKKNLWTVLKELFPVN
jgi:DNA polymerase III psi subunit